MIRTNETPRDAARDVKEEFRRGSPDDVERAAARLGESAAERLEQGVERAGNASASAAHRAEDRIESAGERAEHRVDQVGHESAGGASTERSRPRGRLGRWKQEAQQTWERVKQARSEAERALQDTKSEASTVQDALRARQTDGASPEGTRRSRDQ